MIGGALQFFFCAMIYFSTAFVAQGQLSVGKIYALDFTNIDGSKISTSKGHVVGGCLNDHGRPRENACRVRSRAGRLSGQSGVSNDYGD
jgi:hypothetical protein